MSKQWHGGKGDSRRSEANDDAYRSNYDRIFGNGDSEVKKVTDDGKDKDETTKGK